MNPASLWLRERTLADKDIALMFEHLMLAGDDTWEEA